MFEPTNKQVDDGILSFLPTTGMTFDGIVYRYRENNDWQIEKGRGDNLVHDSLKRLEKAKLVKCESPGPQHKLMYSKIN